LKCYDCQFWIGRCLKGKVNRIAVSEACESFKPKDSFIAGKESSFFIAVNRVQNFPSEKTKKTTNRHQAESLLTVKQSFLLQDGLAEASSNPLVSARRSYASSDFGLEKGGMAWRGVPTSAGIISPPLPKMAETVGGGPFSPGASASPSSSPLKGEWW